MRPGYKQTEVGVIPHEWDVADLQAICAETITYGIVQCGPNIENGVPYIRVSDMNSPNLDIGGMLRTSPTIAAQFSRSEVAEGDIVYALRGKIGEVRSIDSSVAGSNLTQGTARLSPSGRMTSTYLLWCMRSQMALRQGDLAAKGSTFREITLEALRRIKIPVAPLPEQRAIAAALSDVDALLAKLDQLIVKKRDLKQAAMQQLLTGQVRLPGFSEEWEMVKIGDVANVKTGPFGSSLHESDYVQNGTPIITVEHLGEFGVTRQNLPLVSEEDVKRLHSYALDIGDIVFSRVGSVDRNALIRKAEEGWLFSGRLLRVRPDKGRVYAPFLSFQFHTEKFKNAVLSVAVGQTMASLNTKILRDLSVDVPPLAEQTAIATVLSDMDAELAALEARRDKTRALKQGMMQELLTGRIRLV